MIKDTVDYRQFDNTPKPKANQSAAAAHKPMVVAAMDDDDNRFEALFES